MIANTANAAVFGKDNRQPAATADIKVEGVGRLADANTGRFCTAFCVADDIIATAGHCLAGSDLGPPPSPAQMTFTLHHNRAGRNPTPPAVSTRIAGWNRTETKRNMVIGLHRLQTRAPMNAADDWAVAALDAPVCQGRVMALDETPASHAEPLAPLPKNAKPAFIAWHADTATAELHHETSCPQHPPFNPALKRSISQDFAAAGTLHLHTCDTGPGASGGPLLVEVNGEMRVMAINTGTYTRSRTTPSSGQGGEAETTFPVVNTAVRIAPLFAAIRRLEQQRKR